jgi:hypothetical protein
MEPSTVLARLACASAIRRVFSRCLRHRGALKPGDKGGTEKHTHDSVEDVLDTTFSEKLVTLAEGNLNDAAEFGELFGGVGLQRGADQVSSHTLGVPSSRSAYSLRCRQFPQSRRSGS